MTNEERYKKERRRLKGMSSALKAGVPCRVHVWDVDHGGGGKTLAEGVIYRVWSCDKLPPAMITVKTDGGDFITVAPGQIEVIEPGGADEGAKLLQLWLKDDGRRHRLEIYGDITEDEMPLHQIEFSCARAAAISYAAQMAKAKGIKTIELYIEDERGDWLQVDWIAFQEVNERFNKKGGE